MSLADPGCPCNTCWRRDNYCAYWMPILYIKHGITVVVTPLKLLGAQFVDGLLSKGVSAISITAANATNKLFEVILCCEPISVIWTCLAHSVL
jgi:hypothetical protein